MAETKQMNSIYCLIFLDGSCVPCVPRPICYFTNVKTAEQEALTHVKEDMIRNILHNDSQLEDLISELCDDPDMVEPETQEKVSTEIKKIHENFDYFRQHYADQYRGEIETKINDGRTSYITGLGTYYLMAISR